MIRMVLLMLSLLSTGAWAQLTLDTYRVEAPVVNQSEAERTSATKASLGEVITRVTGDSAALQHPLVRQAINDAPNYLAKFSYSSEKMIVLNFSPQAIQTLLQQAQISAIGNSAAQDINLYVAGVNDLASFKQVQNYLKTVSVIHSASLVSVEKDVLRFAVQLDGDEQQLNTVLSAGGRLHAVMGDTPKSLHFNWQN